jgi:hypothetical protein
MVEQKWRGFAVGDKVAPKQSDDFPTSVYIIGECLLPGNGPGKVWVLAYDAGEGLFIAHERFMRFVARDDLTLARAKRLRKDAISRMDYPERMIKLEDGEN